MQIAWNSAELRDICEVSEAADSALGPEVASQLRARLADLLAADSPLDLLAGQPEFVDGDPPAVHIRLSDEAALTVMSNHQRGPTRHPAPTDWSRIRRIRVVSIGGTPDDD